IIAVAGDGPEYASMRSLRQRDRVLPEQLARRGWKFMRVWSTDAFVDPQTDTEKIFDAWRETVETMSPTAVLNAAQAASVDEGRYRRFDSQLQDPVDRYRHRHPQAKKVTVAEVFITRAGSPGPAEHENLPSFDIDKSRADELRSAGLVERARKEQVAEEADAS